MSEEAISREEQRLLRSMNHARVAQPTRPRSWSLNKQSSDFSVLSQQIEKADSKPAPLYPIHPAHLPSQPVHPVHPIHPAHHDYQPDQAQAHANAKLTMETPASERQSYEKTFNPEAEEEKRREAERQAKMEQERFARYLGKTSHTRSPSVGSPNFNRVEPTSPRFNVPQATAKPIASEKPSRQAVMLEISGHGSTKGEAGKQTAFSIKSKSVNIEANQANVNVTVKITVKNSEGKMVEVDNEVLSASDGHTVSYTPLLLGTHTIDVFVGGHLAHTMAVPVVEGGPVASNTEATWASLNNSSVGNRAQMVVTPKSFINNPVPLGYSNLSAKVEHMGTNTPIKNVSVLGNKDGQYVVSFYPAQQGNHWISVTLNSQPIPGSPFEFNVL